MNEMITSQDQISMIAPGGIAKLALDDELTILYATEQFYSLVKNVTDVVNSQKTLALLRNVYSNDIIYVTKQLASQMSRKDNMITLNFRILQFDGSFRWVMLTGTRTDETFQLQARTVPVYSCMGMDVTDHMVKYKKLEKEISYFHTISDLSKDLFFEYRIASDTLTFGELFRETFGYNSEIKEFSKKLESSKLIHPSDLPVAGKVFKNILSGKKQAKFEVRLITKDGETTWYTCYASIVFDENKNPYIVIGKLAMINNLKNRMEDESHKPQYDSLTNTYTKDCSEELIISALGQQKHDSMSAIFLVEIRNYKGVNELVKSVNGEDIMTTIAGFVKSRFRSTDIIGRIGACEFIVLMKDIRSDKNAYEKAESICREVDGQYSYEHNRNRLSISIGIVFAKGEGLQYHTLVSNAKAAQVMAKKESFSSFEVFY